MAARAQRLHRGLVHLLFDIERQAGVETPARGVAGDLRALLVIEHPNQGLHVPLRLHVAAHHAKAHDRLAALGQESRDDGVERPLAGRDLVGPRLQAEAVTAVLQADAEGRLDAAGAEAHVVALDEADHHPVLVGRRQIDGAALDRVAGAEVLRLLHVDQTGAALQVGVVQHLLGRHFHRLALGDVLVGVGESQLHRLDLQVLRIRSVDRHAGEVELLQDAERYQRRDALPVRRNLVQRVAAVVAADRLDPLGLEVGEILGRDGAAVGRRKLLDRLRDLAAIESLALALGDQPQRARRGLELEQLAHFGRPAPGQGALGKAGELAEFRGGVGPLLLHHDRQQVAALGDLDGRLQQVGKRQLAELFAQRHPGADGAGHGDRIETALGRLGVVAVFFLEVGRRPARRRRAGRIEAVQLLAIPQDGEGVAAKPVADRLADRHRGGGGNGGIHCVAALPHHSQSGLRRQRMRSGADVACQHRDTGGGVRIGEVEFHGKALRVVVVGGGAL